MWQAGATLRRGAWASHYRGPSCCRAQAPDARAQYLWLTGLVAPRHVGSSQTRARTRVPCTGRQTLNYCTTREAPCCFFYQNWIFLNNPANTHYTHSLWKRPLWVSWLCFHLLMHCCLSFQSPLFCLPRSLLVTMAEALTPALGRGPSSLLWLFL